MLKRFEIKRLIFFTFRSTACFSDFKNRVTAQFTNFTAHALCYDLSASPTLWADLRSSLLCVSCFMLKERGRRLNDWPMQLCLIQGKYTLIHSRCASPYVSLSHTYTHGLESKRSGCWRKGPTTITFQNNAEWNPDCSVGYMHKTGQKMQ